ncbi:MAG: zinc-binding dehydrogenase [Betaproteobacteria bacterium]|nr:zinc-binding dehydrogenase [Betaproteobacteria bacterium]MDH4326098.1 zinc-binding dehydrogenase [Betaproteobacteria bacterium]MDH5576995.1 zinc-binding dehydrogenase [Betaproteobacteria bacterium]
MRAYFIRAGGGQAIVEPKDAGLPEPGPQQMRVRVRAAGLNRGEFMGAGSAAKPAGTDAAGEVDKLGPGVARFKVGARVMGRCPGGFAEYALLDERETMAVPETLSWESAAAVPIVFLVVYDMLLAQGRLKAGEWLLVTGVTSGVGVAALQTAKALGAHVIGTSGSKDKLAKLAPLGLDVALATRQPDFRDAVLKATGGKGANLCVNNVGGTVFAECVRALAFEGRLAVVGYMDGVLKAEMDLDALHAKRLTLFGVSNKLRNAEQRGATVRGFVEKVLPLIADGRIQPLIDRVYPFDELPAAAERLQANAHVGKIVVTLK